MLPLIAAVVVSVIVLGLVASAAAVLARPLWVRSAHLAPVAGMLGLGVAAMVVFVAYWIQPVVGSVIGVLTMVVSLVVLIRGRAWRYARAGAPGVLAGIGILIVTIGFLALRQTTATDFALVSEFMSGLTATPDNQLPLLVAQRLAEGESTRHVLENWNGSDRPPLLVGLILLVSSPLVPIVEQVPAILALATGIAAQTLWVPALMAFLRSLGASRRATTLTAIFVGVTGSTITNTVYTWPKLLSAAMVIAACALLIDAIRWPGRLPSRLVGAVALAVLGVLSHGAALFTLPLLVSLALAAVRGVSIGRVVRTAAVALAAAALLWAPWLVYQRVVDPPGDRLLKWHLAGVIDEDSRSFVEALVDSYGALSPGEWVAGRLINLVVAFDPTPVRVPWCLCTDIIADRRQVEFFTTMGSLGLGLVVLLIVLLVVIIRALVTRRLRHPDRVLLAIVAACAACIVFWSVLIFLPGTTSAHQGSHVWVLLLNAAGVGWLAHRHPRVVVGLIVAQAALTIVLYGPSLDAIAALGVALVLSGAAMQVLALRAVWR